MKEIAGGPDIVNGLDFVQVWSRYNQKGLDLDLKWQHYETQLPLLFSTSGLDLHQNTSKSVQKSM